MLFIYLYIDRDIQRFFSLHDVKINTNKQTKETSKLCVLYYIIHSKLMNENDQKKNDKYSHLNNIKLLLFSGCIGKYLLRCQ